MADIQLTFASEDYDHIREIATGRVKPEGIQITHLHHPVEEIFFRFTTTMDWEISEISFGMFSSLMAQPNPPYIGLPVFPSRVFRQSSVYLRADGPVKKPEDIAGKRVGVPQWSQTAAIYSRGWIAETLGIPLSKIKWFQSGVNQPGRVETAKIKLPPGVDLTFVSDRSLTEMLLAGDLDVVLSAHPPQAFDEGDKRIVRLFPDYREVEAKYFKDTGIFPIMHTVAIRRDVYERNRWIARNMMTAFEEAKRRSVARLTGVTVSHFAAPWMDLHVKAMGEQIFPGRDHWPYGIDPNRTTIEAFLRFAHDQGVTARHLKPEEIFAPECLATFKV